SQPAPSGACARLDAPDSQLGYQILSFAQQKQCPHNQNLVAILGKKDLQIEGTGARRTDVVIDAKYQKLNAIRADSSDGVYFKNFTAQRTTFNALYVLAGDGFVIDDVLTRWNDEYGFLTFAGDHGLYKNCESYGNGDSGIYPGSASDLNNDRGYEVPRYAIEITGCRSHHNMVGYSGTAGDSVYVHGNEFDHNMGGASMDSAFPGHPGLPQNHARFENNRIHHNNADYYRYIKDGTCSRPPAERGYEQGVVCPQISMPPGTGIITAGGNWNLYEGNWVYGHDRAAFFLSAVPAFIRGEGAAGVERVETQLALAAAAVLILVGAVLWRRRLPGDRLAGAALLLGLAGLALDVAGSTLALRPGPLPALALLATGLAWAGLGAALARRHAARGFATLTLLLGVLTLADAFDQAVHLIPWTPVGLGWPRLVLGLVWVLWAVAAAARRTPEPETAPPAGQPEGSPA
ncbi:hypothetical protein CLM85_02925, partial [Streptomyces albidoflavus]|uniref:right-handed parallel beta-helix repeat-containing protein n=1 Tax=Streptomyces albidoflavus TaxID=1886 RepID=UPI000BB654D2